MRRQQSRRGIQRDARLLPRLHALKAAPPCWGYRRIWASRRCVEPLPVHKKRIGRLRREPHLLVPPHVRLKAKRTPPRSKPQPTQPNEWWGSARTQVLVEGVGWVSLVMVREW
jgi:hypothetical protein